MLQINLNRTCRLQRHALVLNDSWVCIVIRRSSLIRWLTLSGSKFTGPPVETCGTTYQVSATLHRAFGHNQGVAFWQ